jgi:dTDP-4-amino-4,6-dideoxygalactose transaminase
VRAPSYDVTLLGWNYRMDELRASVGLAQLQRLSEWNARRAELTRGYRAVMADRCAQVAIPFADISIPSACHILPAVLPDNADRDAVMGWMHDAGVQTTNHYPPVHLLSFYRHSNPSTPLPLTETFARRELSLPLHPKMQEADVGRVVDTLAEALRHCSRKERSA